MIFHVLTAVLFILQVTDAIDISWWLVLAPSIVVFSFQFFIVLVALLLAWRSFDADKRD